jgi:hypothetical protein
LAASHQHRDYHLYGLDGVLHKERENSMIDLDRSTDEELRELQAEYRELGDRRPDAEVFTVTKNCRRLLLLLGLGSGRTRRLAQQAGTPPWLSPKGRR